MRSITALGRATFAAALLLGGAALAQGQPAPSPQPPAPKPAPAPSTQKPAQDETEALRIRGLVETADENGVTVQLSKGISIRVDIGADTPVYVVNRIQASDLQDGAALSVRTRAAQAVGENTSALEVLAVALTPPVEFPGMNVNGKFKAMEKADDKSVLVVSERSGDRRLSVSNETSFWRLQSAALKDVKPGVSISVLVGPGAGGGAGARRAVFGSTPPGAALPL